MRKLMWFAIGFVVAVFVGAYLLSGKWLLLLSGLLLPLAIVFFCLKKMGFRIAAVVLTGTVLGLLYYCGFYIFSLSNLKTFDGMTQSVSVETTDYSYKTDYGAAVDGVVRLGEKRYSVRLYYDGITELKPGDSVQTMALLRYTPSGGLQPSTYHKGDGIYLLAYSRKILDVHFAESIPVKYLASVLRKNISQRISEIFPQDTAAFARALLLGDDSQLDFQQDISFQKSGIRHIIAVSGLHVSILFSFVYFMTGRKNLLALMVGLPVLFLFSAVAGFTPSVVRACIMQALIVLSMTVSEEYDRATSLAFAALVILVINPLAITSVSFQLSVGSMIGIFLISDPISEYILSRKLFRNMNNKSAAGRFINAAVKSVSITLGSMAVTLPLCACYFGMVSVISIAANLLTLWIVSFVFCGIIVSCLLSLLWIPAGAFAANLISWPIRYILLVAMGLSRIPGAVAYTDSLYTVIWILVCIVLVTMFLLSKRRAPMLLTVAITGFYILSLFATWLEPYVDNMRLTVLDVGQGQCVLLQSKNHAYLVDCGGEDGEYVAQKAMRTLGAQGIQRLDGLILTHYDRDHANGARYFLEAAVADRLYLPDTEKDNMIRRELEDQNVPITWVTDTKKLSVGDGNITIYPSKRQEQGNESSLCILYQRENCAILITGDRDVEGEAYLLEQADIPKLDILVVGHHGAYSASGWELLAHTQPDVAIISVGKDNSHGHPDSYALDRLHRFGCIVRRTDEEGTIYIRG